MKAVLVIDMPSVCDECRLHLESSGGQYRRFCVAKNDISVGKKKPKWCPLRPLPPKLDANDWHRMFSGLFSEREAKGYGWNACIDEITGEKE